jgi:hypothetical protein
MIGFTESLISSQIDSTALTASTTATSILPAAARFTVPANYPIIGKTFRVRAWGRVSTVVTTPGTLTFGFRLGPTSNIIAATSQAFTLVTVATTNVSWFLEWDLTIRFIGGGTTANVMHQGRFESEILGAAGAPVTRLIPASAPAVGTGFDSTTSNIADLFATWSISNANSIQTHVYTLEALS